MSVLGDRCFCYFCFYLIILVNYSQTVRHSTQEIVEHLNPSECKYGEYFNVVSLTCESCDSNKNLEPSDDRLNCVCDKRSKFVNFENGNPICEPCSSGEIPTIDGMDCVSCSESVNNRSCECSPSEIRLERDVNGTLFPKVRCVPCPENTYPSEDGTKCMNCRAETFKSHINCPCPLVSHLRIKEYCVRKNGLMEWPDVRNTYLIKYQSQQIDSFYFRTELQLAVYLCKSGNQTACQNLANMCALTLFSNLIPCRVFLEKQTSPIWLFYEDGGAPAVLNRRKITRKYSLDADSNDSRVNITFATFSTNGRFKSISTPDLLCDVLSNIRFGVNIDKTCKTTARKLSESRMEFYEPYLEFREGDKTLLHALPVLVRNSDKDQSDASQWQLVRKFFIVDTITGVKALPNSLSTDFKREEHPSVIRYAKSIHILIKVQNKEERGKIFPPLLVINYDELLREHVRRNVEVDISYKVTYILADNDMYNAIEISTGVLSGLAVAYAAIKTWSYCKRNGSEIPNASTVFWFLIFFCGLLGNVFIFVSFCASAYTLIFYKGQSVLHVLLPSENNEENVRIFVIVAFCLKVVEVVAFIYRLRKVDLFFVDWEQPRSVQAQAKYDSPRTSLKKIYANRFPAEKSRTSKTPSEIISARRNRTPLKSELGTPSGRSRYSMSSGLNDSNLPEQSCSESLAIGDNAERNNQQKLPVSIWRTYFVANEWFRLQTMRKVNTLAQGILTLLILEVLDVKFWARPDPDFAVRPVDPTLQERESFVLKFAVGTSIYVLVYCTQWLTIVIFCERYVKNHIKEFVDLCSMANISVFILAQNRYGFYIHGRSVHGFADTDLVTLIDNLKQEEDNLCAHRGLLPGTPQQNFVISISTSFKNFYDKIRSPARTEENRFLRRDNSLTSKFEKNIETHRKMREFLTQFLDHCFKDLIYVVREKRLLENIFDIEFTDTIDRSIFYIDNNHSFDRTMFYGNEWTLVTFEITLFNFIAAISGDYTLAVIVTVLTSQLLVFLRKYNGKKNLADKTLIDERFLL